MQSYNEIPASATLAASLSELLANDKTALSNSSGTAFPTTNLQVGMWCLRTDQNKLYWLKDTTPTWTFIADLTKTILYADGTAANSSLLGGLPAYASTTGFGQVWPYVPNVAVGGVMDAGRYIDFHGASADTVDYTVRLDGGGAASTTLTLTGAFTATGDITAFSDERLKSDWRKFGPDFTERLAKIHYGTFTRKDLKDKRQVGVGAQSLQRILPEAVVTADDDFKTLSVAYQAAMAICVHLAGEIVAIKDKLTQLQGA